MKLTFQNKLIASMALLMLVSLTLLGLLSGNLLKREVNQAITSEVENNLHLTLSQAQAWAESKADLVRAAAQQLPDRIDAWPAPLTLIRRGGGFDLAYVGSEQGDMVQSQPPVTLPDTYDPRTRPWYQQAVAERRLIFTPLYNDAGSGDLIMSIAMPLQVNPRHIIAVDLTVSRIVDELLGNRMRWSSETWLLNQQQQVLAHPQGRYLETNGLEQLGLTRFPQPGEMLRVNYQNREWIAASAKIDDLGWYFLLLVDAAEAEAGLTSLAWRVTLFSVFIILAGSLALFLLIRLQLQPLLRLTEALENIAEGEADLTRRLTANPHDEFGRMSQAFNRFTERLQNLISQVAQTTRDIHQDADISTTQVVQNLDYLSQQQAEIAQLASAVSEMSQATDEIARNAENTAARAGEAAQLTGEGLALVQENRDANTHLADQLSQGVAALNQVDEQVQEITGILVTIQGVAEQTNLLALNAAIEAARAGDHGRGFAVVADEVRSLSQRTHAATEEIREMISALQVASSDAVKRMQACHVQAGESVKGSEQAAQRLESINESTNQISDMASQIASAVEEQNAVNTEINSNAESIRHVSDELSHQADASQQRTQELRQRVTGLSELIGKFKV